MLHAFLFIRNVYKERFLRLVKFWKKISNGLVFFQKIKERCQTHYAKKVQSRTCFHTRNKQNIPEFVFLSSRLNFRVAQAFFEEKISNDTSYIFES